MKIIPSGKALAVVNMVVGALLVFGGVQEAISYWGARPAYVTLGLLGAAAGVALFFSGVALRRLSRNARTLTVVSCGATLAVQATAWQFGLLGVPAIALTILYPALVLLSLWLPWLGGLAASRPDATAADKDQKNGFLKRTAMGETI
jgi:hypothetical protein